MGPEPGHTLKSEGVSAGWRIASVVERCELGLGTGVKTGWVSFWHATSNPSSAIHVPNRVTGGAV